MASTWAGTANNETVSFTNLKNAVDTGYFYALATIATSNEQITKADASTYVSIDTAFASYAAKSSNQLVVKSNLKPIFQNSGTFYYNFDTKGWFGWNGSAVTQYIFLKEEQTAPRSLYPSGGGDLTLSARLFWSGGVYTSLPAGTSCQIRFQGFSGGNYVTIFLRRLV